MKQIEKVDIVPGFTRLLRLVHTDGTYTLMTVELFIAKTAQNRTNIMEAKS